MKKQKRLQYVFGVDEFGMIDFPRQFSNVKLCRLMYGRDAGCELCFPHGYETINSTVANRQRNWKRFRRMQWKNYEKGGELSAFFDSIRIQWNGDIDVT
ncbi:hypothetical protein [Parachryseolinea silvisoli]|uniref:hypothetical protein n=1 Tax=Parachryseolinea silvisoli TaxID=2873601 RepID=UPI002265F50F|nr:hypothetical protein [Parachryseolinea silvisoli]MCD9016421.1 hypothetical protein [Parachryseolinea silvisoli]